MDQAAIRESSCVVQLPDRPVRTACLTAVETSVGFEVRELKALIERQSSGTLTRLVEQIRRSQ